MAAALDYLDFTVAQQPIHKPILLIDLPAPIAGEVFFKWLWMPYSHVAIPCNVLDKLVYFLEDPFVLSLPIDIVLKPVRRKDDITGHLPSLPALQWSL